VGDKAYASRGYARWRLPDATIAFKELGLEAIHTWIVEHNQSVRMAKRLKFRLIGRQRQSHCINGRMYDRLWFDLLASEHEEISDVNRRQTA
jgi:RimJ/RimL family protein N-acetyltransferase